MADTVDMKDFVAGFLLEADENLHSVNRNLVAASEASKKSLPEPRAVRELFRSLHTIKGLAAMVGAEPIVDISHEMEGILRSADRAGGRISASALDLLLQGTRAIEERIHVVAKQGIAGLPAAPAALIEALVLEQNGASSQPPAQHVQFELPEDVLKSLSAADREQIIQSVDGGKRVVLIDFRPSPELAAQGFNITAVRERLARQGDLIKVVPHASAAAPTGISFCLLVSTEAENASLVESCGGTEDLIRDVKLSRLQPAAATLPVSNSVVEPSPEWAPTDQASIRVDVRRLDEALERLSALVVTRSKLARVAADLSASGVDTRELDVVISENTRQLKRLRAAITVARMVPLTELLQRLPLVVRGLTKDSRKSVNVIIQAGSAEVDKAVADKIFPAVVHLIRNAVDHAIETCDERALAKKPEEATISIICDDSSGSSLMLSVSDDGRGIDREAVARKAGKTPAGSDEELLKQITTPGLSTRDGVTQTSGRGMGMDIVKRTIEVLGGTLAMQTTPGIGTTFTLRVPVSVTIVDVLSFVSGGQTFVTPVSMINEIVEIDPSAVTPLPSTTEQGPETRLIQRRGSAIPMFALDSVLHRRRDSKVPSKALVIDQGRGAIAFGVDRMLGQQEVVVRPLDEALVRSPGMAGATDLGDGRPTLVLDLATLGASIGQIAGGA